jgi:hypothetical protein
MSNGLLKFMARFVGIYMIELLVTTALLNPHNDTALQMIIALADSLSAILIAAGTWNE